MQRQYLNQQHQKMVDSTDRPSQTRFVLQVVKNTQMRESIVIIFSKEFSRSYGEIVSCFGHLAKDIILQPYIVRKKVS